MFVFQDFQRRTITREDAEHVAHNIALAEASVRALIIISEDGTVLAHARSPRADDDESPSDIPDLMRFPRYGVSVFVKRAGYIDVSYLYNRTSKALGSVAQSVA
jgi:hypothetical protein